MKQKNKSVTRAIFIVSILIGLTACATVPKESADLSIELGKQISSIETAHLTLVAKYFDEKRNRVDEFIMKEWVPEFASNFFANEQIAQMWEMIVKSGNTTDRLEFIVTLGPKLQSSINAKRLELIKPLNDAERIIVREIRNGYDQAKAINNSITSFLVSSSKVSENQKRYLEMLGVKDEKIAEALDQVDSAVSSLLGKAEQASDKVEKANSYFEKLTSAMARIKAKGGK